MTVPDGAHPLEIKQHIRGFILSNFYVLEPNQLVDDASLSQSGLIDSTGMMEVILFLERHFELVVEDVEVTPGNLDSIDRLVRFVGKKREASALPMAAATAGRPARAPS